MLTSSAQFFSDFDGKRNQNDAEHSEFLTAFAERLSNLIRFRNSRNQQLEHHQFLRTPLNPFHIESDWTTAPLPEKYIGKEKWLLEYSPNFSTGLLSNKEKGYTEVLTKLYNWFQSIASKENDVFVLYISDIEGWLEARFWEEVLTFLHVEHNVPVGRVKVSLNISTIPALIEAERTIYLLKDFIIGVDICPKRFMESTLNITFEKNDFFINGWLTSGNGLELVQHVCWYIQELSSTYSFYFNNSVNEEFGKDSQVSGFELIEDLLLPILRQNTSININELEQNIELLLNQDKNSLEVTIAQLMLEKWMAEKVYYTSDQRKVDVGFIEKISKYRLKLNFFSNRPCVSLVLK